MAIVSMLSPTPKNGVELIDEIEKMTQGWWRPSPGSVYPVLEQLTNDGMIRKRDDGRYELTEKANEELEWSFGPSFRKSRSVEEMMDEISGFVSYMEDLKKSGKLKAASFRERFRDLGKKLTSLAEGD